MRQFLFSLVLIWPLIVSSQSTEPQFPPTAGTWKVKISAPTVEEKIERTCIFAENDLTTTLACVDNPVVDPTCISSAGLDCYFMSVSLPMDATNISIVAKNYRSGLESEFSNRGWLLMLPSAPQILSWFYGLININA